MLGIIEILCGLIVFLFYYYLTATFNFWKKRNIPGPPPKLLFGTIKDVILGKTILGKYLKNLYDTYDDKNTPFVGIFDMREPILMIKDPKYIKDILIRDAALFSNRGYNGFVQAEPLNLSIFYLDGVIAHNFRQKLSLLFTPSRLKKIHHMMLKSLVRLNNYLEKSLPETDYIMNCSDLAIRLTADMIGNNLLGIDLKTLTSGTNVEKNDFIKHATIVRGTYWNNIMKMIIKSTCPRLYNWIGYHLFNNAKATQFYVNFTFDIMKYRKEHAIVRQDLIGLLMELKENYARMSELIGTDISNEFLGAQIFGFFYAGYETSATTMCNALYELTFNKNIQNKLREEIRETYAKNNGELQYDSINEMPYLNAVFKETLRKYPILDGLQREAMSSYTFRNTNITLQKKQKIVIPLMAIHQDPKIYPEPEVFRPERFIDKFAQPKESIHYFPFGLGPRNCIGERVGILQIKLGLIGILQNYALDICEKTATNYGYITQTIVKLPDTDIFIKMTKIN